MFRLVSLLILFALVVTNGPAIAAAMCQHGDARAHAAALQSDDPREAGAALDEHSAAEAARDVALGDAAGNLLAGYMVPAEPASLSARALQASQGLAIPPAVLGSRSDPPLLEPPLA